MGIDCLKKGERAKILGFKPCMVAYRKKLLAMGVTPGSEFTLIRVAPLGDPVQIHIRDFDLVLRSKEADVLFIERVIK